VREEWNFFTLKVLPDLVNPQPDSPHLFTFICFDFHGNILYLVVFVYALTHFMCAWLKVHASIKRVKAGVKLEK
jgi:hypothetical protein